MNMTSPQNKGRPNEKNNTNKNLQEIMDYHLYCRLKNHTNEVRGICKYNKIPGAFVSCSFDKTVILWLPDEKLGYKHSRTFVGHKDFVVSVRDDGDDIISISHDKHLIIWDVSKGVEKKKVEVQEKNTSALHVSEKHILTGGWDHVAKVYDKNMSLLHRLKGHFGYILGILELSNGDIVTGCGDSTMKIWRKGKCINTLKPHKSCVRGMVNIPNGAGFMSCSNDGYINTYDNAGNKLDSFLAHDNLIYNIKMTKNGVILTSSEDLKVKIWKNKKCIATLEHPACIWDCDMLDNGDVCVACADGNVYVWSTQKEKTCSENVKKEFKDAIFKFKEKKSGIKVNELPKMEALKIPGKKNGEVKMINVEGRGKAFQWDAKNGKWELVGDIIDGPNSEQFNNKKLFEGKWYDYVWDVELEFDNGPDRVFHLPYNLGEDSYVVAQNFIHKHNLAQKYLDTIARFITKNSGQGFHGVTSQEVFDPFARETAELMKKEREIEKSKEIAHFPIKEFDRVEKGNWKGIFKKLNQFNGKLEKEELKLNEKELKLIENGLKNFENKKWIITKDIVHVIQTKVLKWEMKLLFPGLDLYRAFFLCPNVFTENIESIVTNLLSLCFHKDASNGILLMGLKCFINICSQESLRKALPKNLGKIITCSGFCKKFEKDSFLFMYVRFLRTFSLLCKESGSVNEVKALASDICDLLIIIKKLKLKMKESCLYFLVQSMGTLICSKSEAKKEVIAVCKEKKFGKALSSVDSKLSKLTAAIEQIGYFMK